MKEMMSLYIHRYKTDVRINSETVLIHLILKQVDWSSPSPAVQVSSHSSLFPKYSGGHPGIETISSLCELQRHRTLLSSGRRHRSAECVQRASERAEMRGHSQPKASLFVEYFHGSLVDVVFQCACQISAQ